MCEVVKHIINLPRGGLERILDLLFELLSRIFKRELEVQHIHEVPERRGISLAILERNIFWKTSLPNILSTLELGNSGGHH